MKEVSTNHENKLLKLTIQPSLSYARRHIIPQVLRVLLRQLAPERLQLRPGGFELFELIRERFHRALFAQLSRARALQLDSFHSEQNRNARIRSERQIRGNSTQRIELIARLFDFI